MLYYLIIGLQIYCAYHVYKTQNQPYWYLIILLVPLLGCAIYLFTQTSKRAAVSTLTKEFQDNFQPSKKIETLEKQLAFADTFQNRILLAEGYFSVNAFAKAEQAYLHALKGSHATDYDAQTQLLRCYFRQDKFDHVVALGEKIAAAPNFEKSNAQFIYGLSLAKLDQHQKALPILQKVDQRYFNYNERLQLARYYLTLDRKEDALTLLSELLTEAANMTPANKRKYKATMAEVERLHASLSS